MRQWRSSGQVGIVLLLVTVVMLTVGISTASRTVGDVRTSRVGEDANRALDAAESGVEEALSQDLSSFSGGTGGTTSDVSVSTSVNRLATFESRVEQGETAAINTAGVPNNSVLTINWAKESACATQASLMIQIFNQSGGNTTARRQYVGVRPGPCTNRNTADGFANGSAPTAGSYNISTAVTLRTGDVLVRVRPVYNHTDLRVSAGAWLTTQMYKVRAVAQSTTGRETKAVEVDRSLPVAPTIFDYVLYSGGSITQ